MFVDRDRDRDRGRSSYTPDGVRPGIGRLLSKSQPDAGSSGPRPAAPQFSGGVQDPILDRSALSDAPEPRAGSPPRSAMVLACASEPDFEKVPCLRKHHADLSEGCSAAFPAPKTE